MWWGHVWATALPYVMYDGLLHRWGFMGEGWIYLEHFDITFMNQHNGIPIVLPLHKYLHTFPP